MDAAELSEWIGLTKTKIYELVRASKIPFVPIGTGRVYFRPARIEEWLDELEGRGT